MTCVEIETELADWVQRVYHRRINVTDFFIKRNASELMNEFNAANEPEKRVSMKFSNVWIWKSKKRHGVKMYRSHGESGDANEAAVLKSLAEIRNKIKKYALNDIWNADEFGLFFKMAPTTKIGPGRLHGRKVQKDRVTFMACTNIDGSEKFPLLVIGKSKTTKGF